jgi:hypothetical protein
VRAGRDMNRVPQFECHAPLRIRSHFVPNPGKAARPNAGSMPHEPIAGDPWHIRRKS